MPTDPYQSRHTGDTIDDAVDIALSLSQGTGPASLQTAARQFAGFEGAQIQVINESYDYVAINFDAADLTAAYGGNLVASLLVAGEIVPILLTQFEVYTPNGDVYTGPSGVFDLYHYGGSTASGAASDARGEGTLAEGDFADARGLRTHAEGLCATASGVGSVATADFSCASGFYGQANRSGARAHGLAGVESEVAQEVTVGAYLAVGGAGSYMLDNLAIPLAPLSVMRFEGMVLAQQYSDGAVQSGSILCVVSRGETGAPSIVHSNVAWDGGSSDQGTIVLGASADGMTVTVVQADNEARKWGVMLRGLDLSPRP